MCSKWRGIGRILSRQHSVWKSPSTSTFLVKFQFSSEKTPFRTKLSLNASKLMSFSFNQIKGDNEMLKSFPFHVKKIAKNVWETGDSPTSNLIAVNEVKNRDQIQDMINSIYYQLPDEFSAQTISPFQYCVWSICGCWEKLGNMLKQTAHQKIFETCL